MSEPSDTGRERRIDDPGPSGGSRMPAAGARPGGSMAGALGPSTAKAEPRQRWRITYERDAVVPERVGRAAVDEWAATIESSGLRSARMPADPDRVRLAFAAALPANATGRRELVDIWLLDRVARWELNEAIACRLPPDHRWVDAEDVWLGEPPLPGQVIAANWRISVTAASPGEVDRGRLGRAIDEMLAAPTIERLRIRGGTERRYDLRPLVGGVELLPGEPLYLLVRTRFDPERGAGRPEEVVAALADVVGVALDVESLTRTDLVLARDAVA